MNNYNMDKVWLSLQFFLIRGEFIITLAVIFLKYIFVFISIQSNSGSGHMVGLRLAATLSVTLAS